jgi:hypothetical protein
LALALVGGVGPFDAATAPEALRDVEVAQNIRDGRGIAIENPAAVAPAPAVVPFTADPPLYPLVLSLFLNAEEPGQRAAARVGQVALFMSAFVFFELLYPAIGYGGALLAVFVFSVCRPAVAVFTGVGSEALTVPLLLFAVWCCLRCVAASAGGPTRRHAVYLGLLVLAVAALSYTRYVGVLFFVLLLLTWRLSGRARLARHVAAAASATVLCGALYLRNYLVSGFVSGAERASSTTTLPANLADAGRAFYDQVASGGGTLLVLALVTAGLIALRWLRAARGPAGASEPAPDYGACLTRIAWVSFVTYTLGVTAIATVKRLDVNDTRLIAPGFAMLVLLLAVEAGRHWREPSLSVRGTAVFAGAVLALGLIAARGLEARSAGSTGPAENPQRASPEPDSTDRLAEARLELAERVLRGGRYRTAAELFGAVGSASGTDGYRIAKGLATAHAGLADVAASLEHTRRCLGIDRARAEVDIVEMAAPYFADRARYRDGIEYYERLRADFPDAWWIDVNIATLARSLGDAELARTSAAAAERLRSRDR